MFKIGKVQIQKNEGQKHKQGITNPLDIEWTQNAQIVEKWKKGFKENVQNG